MKISYFSLILVLLLIIYFKGNSQGVLDNQFIFLDGIYLSPEEYFSNSPSVMFNENEMPIAKYGKFNESQFRNIYYKDSEGKNVKLNIKDIWGISVKGVPYVFSGFSVVNETDISFLANTIRKSRNLIFSEIIYVGTISMYYFNQEHWMIKANNCKPFKITLRKIRENIKDDAELLAKFKMEKHKRKYKHSYLVQYNQRHPVILNQLAQKN